MTEADYEMSIEGVEEESRRIKSVFQRAFDIWQYKTYIYYRLNPEKIEESIATKRAFEYGKDGAINLIRKDYPGRSDEEYEAALNKFVNRERQRFEEEPHRYDDFKKEAEGFTRIADHLPPLSKLKRKDT